MAYAVLTEATLTNEVSTAVLAGIHLSAGAQLSAVLTKARLTTAATAVTVNAGLDAASDPFEWVPLSATIGGSPDSVAWTLVSATNSATATPLTPSSAATGYWAPPTVNGTVLRWRCTATKSGVPVSDDVVHTITNHAGPWLVTGSNYLTLAGRRGIKISALNA